MIKMHSIQKGLYFFIFLEIHYNWRVKMHLKTTLYHILAILENFGLEERKKHNSCNSG